MHRYQGFVAGMFGGGVFENSVDWAFDQRNVWAGGVAWHHMGLYSSGLVVVARHAEKRGFTGIASNPGIPSIR
jgi:hypothetical protein